MTWNLAACAALHPHLPSIELMRADPPEACTRKAYVNALGYSRETIQRDLKVKAAQLGANFVRLDAIDDPGLPGWLKRGQGTAYICPQKKTVDPYNQH